MAECFHATCMGNKTHLTNLYPSTNGYLSKTCKSQNMNPIYLTLTSPSVLLEGAQWLSGRVLDSRPSRGFEPHRRHCAVVLEQHFYPSHLLVQPRKTRPCLTERLLMGRKESNQTNTQKRIITNTCQVCFRA